MSGTVTDLEPHLTRSPAPGGRGVVLMLHGIDRSADPLDNRSPSWLRMRVMLSQTQRELHRRGLHAWLLRYRFGGWSSAVSGPSPVHDARWALDRVRAELGDVPVVLLGHSMGARTAVTVADDPLVRGVVALAPWFNPGDPVRTLAGRHLRAAHGRADRITSFAATQAYVHRASAVAASTGLVDMGALGHYMLGGRAGIGALGRWNRVAVDAVGQVLG